MALLDRRTVLSSGETSKKIKKIPRKYGSDLTDSWNEYTWTDTAKNWASILQTKYLTLTYKYLPIYLGLFFSAFAKLRKATVRFMMYVRLSVGPYICPFVGPHGTIRLPMNGFS